MFRDVMRVLEWESSRIYIHAYYYESMRYPLGLSRLIAEDVKASVAQLSRFDD